MEAAFLPTSRPSCHPLYTPATPKLVWSVTLAPVDAQRRLMACTQTAHEQHDCVKLVSNTGKGDATLLNHCSL